MKIVGIESLELLFSKLKNSCYFATSESSPAYDFFKTNISPNHLLTLKQSENFALHLNDDKAIEKSDLNQRVMGEGIDSFWISHRTSRKLVDWEQNSRIKLLANQLKHQTRFENKIVFDDLLRQNKLPVPQGKVLSGTSDLQNLESFPAVLQIPESDGSTGTFFVSDRREIEQLLKLKKLSFPCLFRQYIDGIPLGITALIGKENLIFSSLRLQLFFLNNKGGNDYYGIQWLPSTLFSKAFYEKLSSSLKKICTIFRDQGFSGVANFDLIAKDNEFYFIECNPRLSLSSAQLTNQKELFHGLDFTEEFAQVINEGDSSSNKPTIPQTDYQGATIDLDFVKNKCGKERIFKTGTYSFTNHDFIYESNKLDDFATDKIFAYTNCLITNFPVATIQNDRFALSKYGQDIIASIQANTN